MFNALTLRGPTATILWGHRSAAALGKWAVRKRRDEKTQTPVWTLVARLGPQVDRFQLGAGSRDRRCPLMFTAPRKGGFWCWPVLAVQVGPTMITARLGPPEQ